MSRKTNFKNSWQYKRILQILDDYWICQPDEKLVEVTMKFEHSNGETQRKCIVWENPKHNKM